MQNFDQVQRAYDELVASGDITIVPNGPAQDNTINEQKAYMTRRAAYYLNLIDPNYGLLAKVTGTNVMGLSTDIVIKHNGDYYDIATDIYASGGRKVSPVNGGATNDPTLIANWVQPTKEWAGVNGVIPIPPDDTDAKLDAILASQTGIAGTLNTFLSNQTALGNLMESYHTTVMTLLQEILDKPIEYPQYAGKLGLSMTFSPKK